MRSSLLVRTSTAIRELITFLVSDDPQCPFWPLQRKVHENLLRLIAFPTDEETQQNLCEFYDESIQQGFCPQHLLFLDDTPRHISCLALCALAPHLELESTRVAHGPLLKRLLINLQPHSTPILLERDLYGILKHGSQDEDTVFYAQFALNILAHRPDELTHVRIHVNRLLTASKDKGEERKDKRGEQSEKKKKGEKGHEKRRGRRKEKGCEKKRRHPWEGETVPKKQKAELKRPPDVLEHHTDLIQEMSWVWFGVEPSGTKLIPFREGQSKMLRLLCAALLMAGPGVLIVVQVMNGDAESDVLDTVFDYLNARAVVGWRRIDCDVNQLQVTRFGEQPLGVSLRTVVVRDEFCDGKGVRTPVFFAFSLLREGQEHQMGSRHSYTFPSQEGGIQCVRDGRWT
jgi:hypothetical protein